MADPGGLTVAADVDDDQFVVRLEGQPTLSRPIPDRHRDQPQIGPVRMPSTVSTNPDRLGALRRLLLLDTPPNPTFDRLTQLAAQLLEQRLRATPAI